MPQFLEDDPAEPESSNVITDWHGFYSTKLIITILTSLVVAVSGGL